MGGLPHRVGHSSHTSGSAARAAVTVCCAFRSDDADYAGAMEAAADQVVEDAPGVWLYNSPNIVISSEGVEGLPQNDLGVGMDLSEITVGQ